jgi:hypothetical protein
VRGYDFGDGSGVYRWDAREQALVPTGRGAAPAK